MLALALLVCGAIGISVNAAEGDASLTVVGKNLSFENQPRLAFAIKAEGVTDEISVIYSENEDMTDAKTAIALGNMNVNGTEYPAFALEGVNPQDVSKVFYVKAVAGGVESAVVKYSVLEWALEGAVTTDKAIFDAAVAYYAAVQDELNYGGVHADEYKYVKVVDGKIGEATSALTTEDSVTLTYTGTSACAGWDIEYIDGTVGFSNTDTVTIAKSCKITPKLLETLTEGENFDDLTALIGDGSDSDVMFGTEIYQTSDANGQVVSGDEIKIVKDPTGRDNNVLMFKDGSESSYSSIWISVKSANGKATNGISIFETKLYVPKSEILSAGALAQPQYGASSGGRLCYENLVISDDKSYMYFELDNTEGAETEGNITTDAWHTLRLEFYNYASGAGTPIIKIYVDNLYAGYTDVTTVKDTTGFRWAGVASAKYTIYFDNMSLTEKAMPTE